MNRSEGDVERRQPHDQGHHDDQHDHDGHDHHGDHHGQEGNHDHDHRHGQEDNQQFHGKVRQHRDLAGRDSTNQTDVFLDVPQLKVEEITLKVEGLRAKVSLQAEVLQLLKLNVGVDACLDCVDLSIRGVEAQAQLQVRLDNVVRAIEGVLATIDDHPDILTNITSGAGQAVEDVGGGAKETVGEVGKGASEATKEVGGGAGQATKEVGEGAGQATKEVGEGAGETTKEVGGGAGEAAKGIGGGAGEAVKGIGGSVPAQAARHVASEAGKKAKDLATRELVSVLGNRTVDAAERIIKRFTTKED